MMIRRLPPVFCEMCHPRYPRYSFSKAEACADGDGRMTPASVVRDASPAMLCLEMFEYVWIKFKLITVLYRVGLPSLYMPNVVEG